MTVPLRRAWVALAVLGSAFACDADNVTREPWGLPERPGASSSGLPGNEPPAPPIPTPACEPFGDLRLAMPAEGAFYRDGWEQLAPAPFLGDVMSIAGTSAHDVWWSGAVTAGTPKTAAIAHFDGTRTTALLGVGVPTWPIAVVSPTEVWLGPHLRFVGGALERSPSSAPGTAGMRFFGSDDGWSVGAGVWHWNGTEWTLQNGVGLGPFTAVDGLAPTDVWVAGSDRISRWNGTTWSPTPPLPGGPQIRDLRVRAPNDVWAVGSGIFHYDGATWQELPSSIDSWRRTFTSGSRVYFLGLGAIGQLEGGVVRASDDNAQPCATIANNFGVCNDGFLAPTGELFIAAYWSGVPGSGPWRRPAGATTSAGTTSLLSLLGPDGPSSDAMFRGTTSGRLIALDRGKLFIGPIRGPWTELAPPLPLDSTLEILSGLSGSQLWVTFHQTDNRYGAVRFDGTGFGTPALFPAGFVPDESGPYSFDEESGGCNGRGGTSPLDPPQSVFFDGNVWTSASADELVLSKSDRFRLVRDGIGGAVGVERLKAGQWIPQHPSGGGASTLLPLMATGPRDVVALSNHGKMWRWDGVEWTAIRDTRGDNLIDTPAIYLGDSRIWVRNNGRSGLLEGPCIRLDNSVSVGTKVSGNAERIFALGATAGWQVRTRSVPF